MSIDNNNIKTSVTKYDLYDNFYTTLDSIKSKLNSKEHKKQIFESSASGKIKWLILMVIAIFILITSKPVLEYNEPEMLIFGLLFPGIGFSILISSLIGAIEMPKLLAIIWGGLFGGIPWVHTVLPSLTQNPIYFIMYIIGILCISVIIFFIKVMPKRTPLCSLFPSICVSCIR